MRLVGLISGGKDSVYNMLQCISAGHDVVAVANIEPSSKVEELNSYMYQSVGHQVVSLIASALALPIYRQKTKGKALCKTKTYVQISNDEVEDLLELLSKVKKEIQIDGVSVGAIASDYQRTRVENVCKRLNLKVFAYLWRRDQEELLQEMIDSGLDAIIIKVASLGLSPEEHLGMHIRDIKSSMTDLKNKYGVNMCGEGGEYETLTLDCPLFHRSIDITEYEKVILSNDAFAPVAFLNVKNAVLRPKYWGTDDPFESLKVRLNNIRSTVKNPFQYIEDCIDEESLTIFPQMVKKSISNLPFSFDSDSTLELSENDNQSSTGGFWRKSALALGSSSSLKIPSVLSSTLFIDSTACNSRYSTGWCCIGNVNGATLNDAFNFLQKHLERIKYDFRDVVMLNLFVKDLKDFVTINKVYAAFVPELSPPARVCVETPMPSEINVIISLVAHKIVSKSQKALHQTDFCEKDVMHVQSISHWAPANIGPYSQCVRVGNIYFVAGQIPLIPGTMELLGKPPLFKCKLSLRHVLRILNAMNENLDFSSVFHVICYVTLDELTMDIPSMWNFITNNETTTITVVIVSGLPRKATMEWEVIACNLNDPQVDEDLELIDEFHLYSRRCSYKNPYVASIVCNIFNVKKKGEKSHKSLKIITHEGVSTFLKHCLNFLRGEVKNQVLPLCSLKLFYKVNDTVICSILNDVLKLREDPNVVATAIPVIACQMPDIVLTIAGVCY